MGLALSHISHEGLAVGFMNVHEAQAQP